MPQPIGAPVRPPRERPYDPPHAEPVPAQVVEDRSVAAGSVQ